MFTVFICFAPADRPIAEAIAQRIRTCTEATPLLDELSEQTVASAWEGGDLSSAIVLLLSPESVPARVRREDWYGLLEHVVARAEPLVATVLVRPCGFPPLLDRNTFRVPWEESETVALRQLQRWIAGLQERNGTAFTPARLPRFEGREKELAALWEQLVDRPGTLHVVGPSASGKSCLAQQFAWQTQDFFREVFWVGARDRGQGAVWGELAAQAGGTSLEVIREHRVLAIIDDLHASIEVDQIAGGLASVLVTRTDTVVSGAPVLELTGQAPKRWPELPGERQQQLAEAMAACRSDCFSLRMAARVAGMDDDAAVRIAAELVEAGVVEMVDERKQRYRYCRSAHRTLRHAEAIADMLREGCRSQLDTSLEELAEAEAAYNFVHPKNWPLAAEIAKAAATLLLRRRRNAEALDWLDRLAADAEDNGDEQSLAFANDELSWISDSSSTRRGSISQTGIQLALEFAS